MNNTIKKLPNGDFEVQPEKVTPPADRAGPSYEAECAFCLAHGSGACYALGADPEWDCTNNR